MQTDATLNNAGTGATSISGQLGNVSVTDARGGTAAWSVDATFTAFSEGLGPDSTAVSYNAGAIAETGGGPCRGIWRYLCRQCGPVDGVAAPPQPAWP